MEVKAKKEVDEEEEVKEVIIPHQVIYERVL